MIMLPHRKCRAGLHWMVPGAYRVEKYVRRDLGGKVYTTKRCKACQKLRIQLWWLKKRASLNQQIGEK